MHQNNLVAIVVHNPTGVPQFAKYRYNIKDTNYSKSKFLKDMQRKFPALLHINYYDKQTGAFIEQRKP